MKARWSLFYSIEKSQTNIVQYCIPSLKVEFEQIFRCARVAQLFTSSLRRKYVVIQNEVDDMTDDKVELVDERKDP